MEKARIIYQGKKARNKYFFYNLIFSSVRRNSKQAANNIVFS